MKVTDLFEHNIDIFADKLTRAELAQLSDEEKKARKKEQNRRKDKRRREKRITDPEAWAEEQEKKTISTTNKI